MGPFNPSPGPEYNGLYQDYDITIPASTAAGQANLAAADFFLLVSFSCFWAAFGGFLLSALVGIPSAYACICQCKRNRCLNYQTCNTEKWGSDDTVLWIFLVKFYPLRVDSFQYADYIALNARCCPLFLVDHDPHVATRFEFFESLIRESSSDSVISLHRPRHLLHQYRSPIYIMHTVVYREI